MVVIPAGNFAMGDAFSEGEPCDVPVHDVYVGAFAIHAFPVTKEYWDRVFKWAAGHGYAFDNSGSGRAPNHPVHSVNWHDCIKWCNAHSEMENRRPCYYTAPDKTAVYRVGHFEISNSCVDWSADGYRLPTEAEWEKAARGGLAGQRFPWGDRISHEQANFNSDWIGAKPYYPYDVSRVAGYHPTVQTGGTTPVGSFPPNPIGLFDLAGNVFERCWDWYDENWYRDSRSTEKDPHGPETGDARVVRGGSWHAPARQARVACRWSGSTTKASDDRGFRCVRTEEQSSKSPPRVAVQRAEADATPVGNSHHRVTPKRFSSLVTVGDLRNAGQFIRDSLNAARQARCLDDKLSIQIDDHEEAVLYAIRALKYYVESGEPEPELAREAGGRFAEINAGIFKGGEVTVCQSLVTLGAILLYLTSQGSRGGLPSSLPKIAAFCDDLLERIAFGGFDDIWTSYNLGHMRTILIIDRTGQAVVELNRYWSVGRFSEGLAQVQLARGGRMGYIDPAGELVITLEKGIDTAERFSEGMARLRDRQSDSCGIIDKTGASVIPFGRFSGLGYRFSQGLCPAKAGRGRTAQWGFIDPRGEFIIQPEYKFIPGEGFSDGLASVGDGQEKNGYIDINNKMVIPPIYFHTSPFAQGLACVRASREALTGVIDKSGREVIAPRFTRQFKFSEGLAAVTYGEELHYGFIDTTGREIIAPAFEHADDFSEGLAGVTLKGKRGFIDKSGNVVIPPQYDKYGGGTQFSGGLCAVTIAG